MLALTDELTFRETVKVRMPATTGMGFAEKTFTGHFRVLSDEEVEACDFTTLDGLKAYVRAFFVGWGTDLVEDEKTRAPLAYSDETRDRLIGIPFIRAGLLATYNAAIAGVRAGN